MSETLEHLRKKIEGTEKLGSVVRTMKTLAASQLHHYEAAIRSLEFYSYSLELGLLAFYKTENDLYRKQEGSSRNSPPKKHVIVFGSDQSLVGQFNEVMFEKIKQSSFSQETNFFVIGERLASLLENDFKSVQVFHLPHTLAEITTFVKKILLVCESSLKEDPSSHFDLFYHCPDPQSIFRPSALSLFPLDSHIKSRLQGIKWPSTNIPEVLGKRDETWHTLRREYLFMMLFKACASSLATENASRLAAMQRAEKSIEELLDDLGRIHQRLRQEGIDAELFDVLSGVEALGLS